MFTRKGNSKFNQGRHDGSQLEGNELTPVHPQQQPTELTPQQRVDALDTTKFPSPTAPDNTVIGKNFNLEGDNIVIRCKGTLSINGTVNADIHCEHLSVADSAHISGTIAADEVSIHGEVEGTINGTHVTLHRTANVEADINSQYLSIERGARFDGRSHRVTDPAEIAPKLMSSANDSHEPNSQAPVHAPTPPTQTRPVETLESNAPATTLEPTTTVLEDTPGHSDIQRNGTGLP